jgi:hypothetical protein
MVEIDGNGEGIGDLKPCLRKTVIFTNCDTLEKKRSQFATVICC